MILATQRALEQQALERWRMQKEAQIEDMMRRGIPLGAVAAALASPETAERIAVLEAATTGNLSAIDAARLNVQRAEHDLSLLDGLREVDSLPSRHTADSTFGTAFAGDGSANNGQQKVVKVVKVVSDAHAVEEAQEEAPLVPLR